MKKTLYLLILVALFVALTACGGNETPTPEATEAPAAEPTEAEVEAPPPTEAPAATEAPVSEPVTVEVVGAAASTDSLVNIIWQWAEMIETQPASQTVVAQPERYQVVFLPDGTVNITADCNVVLGTYTLEGEALTIQTGPSTLALCPEDSLDQTFLAFLAQVNRATLDGGRLFLYLANDAGRMGFNNGGPAGNLAAEVGIDPSQVSLDTQGLPYSWQPVLVAESAYDQSQPPGPMGLPAHMQILFGVTDPADRQPQDPIMYIIPVEAYEQMWVAAGNDSVAQTMDRIWDLTVAIPFPAPTSGMPALPSEEIGGVNDLAAQLGRPTATDFSASKNGYRFVGRWAQDANPVSNQGMQYVYQGFTNDGEYLVSFWYPVASATLPMDAASVSQEELDSFNADPQANIAENAAELNALPTSDWAPDLATLDALVASLEIQGMPGSGLPGNVWQYVARNFDGQMETPIGLTQTNTVVFNLDGTVSYVADCNTGTGTYAISGGMIGTIATQLGATTLVACPEGSNGQELTDTLASAQNFNIRPGGDLMELIRPAGGGYIVLRNLGPSEAGGPEVELPEPPAGTPIGTVIAPLGVNVRTGPSTAFAALGVAPYGTEGEIAGQSADGQWFMTPLPDSPTGQGWVSAAFIAVSGGGDIPVVASPPLPATPVPTATPMPTATPSPTIQFTADSTVINQGQCTTLRWSVQNVQAVWVYPLGQPFDQFPVTGEGSQEVCPSFTTTYELRVQRTDGVVELRQVTVNVNVTNPLANSTWLVSTLNVNQVPLPDADLTLSFTTDAVSAFGGCNNFNGGYTLSGSSLSIGPLAGTQVFCSDALNAQEAVYTGLLQSATSYQLVGFQLVLYDGAGNEIIRFLRIG